MHSIILPTGVATNGCQKAWKMMERSTEFIPLHTGYNFLLVLIASTKKKQTQTVFGLIWFEWKRPWSWGYGKRSSANCSWSIHTPITAHLRYHPHVQIWNFTISKRTRKFKTEATVKTDLWASECRKPTGRFQQSISSHTEAVNRGLSIHGRVLQSSRTENCSSAATLQEH